MLPQESEHELKLQEGLGRTGLEVVGGGSLQEKGKKAPQTVAAVEKSEVGAWEQVTGCRCISGER